MAGEIELLSVASPTHVIGHDAAGLPVRSPATAARAMSRIWAQIGDSRTQNGGANVSGSSQPWANPATEASTLVSKRSNGYQFWAEYHSRYRIQFPLSLNFGVSGDTAVNALVTNAATRLDVAIAQAVAAGAAGIVFWFGTNDWTGSAAYAAVIAAYEAGIAKAQAAGLLVMFITDTPRGHSSFTSARLSAVNLRKMLRARQWLLAQRNRAGIFVVDGMEDLADQASTLGDWQSAQDTSDGTHLTQRSASRIGQRIAAIASVLYPPCPIMPASNADLYDAVDNPAGSIAANPMMDGTGGSNGGNANASGVCATSWPALYNNLTGFTAAFSKQTINDPDTGNPKVWQQVALSGTPTVANTYVGFKQSLPIATYPAGTRIQIVGEVAWDAGIAGVEGIKLGMEGGRANAPGFWLVYAGSVGAGGKEQDQAKAYSGLMVTDPFTLMADVTSNEMRFVAQLIQNATLNATIRCRLAARIVA